VIGTSAAAAPALHDASVTSDDAVRALRCRPHLGKWLLLLAQMGLALAAFRAFKLQELFGEGFWRVSWLAVAGFALHYWLPLRLKEPASIALSLGALPFVVGPLAAALLLALGLAFFAIGRSSLPQRARVALALLLAVPCVVGRARGFAALPDELWVLI